MEPPQAVVITMSGIYAGINNFRTLAGYVLRRTLGRVRFWLTDRRSNLLEDRRGVLYAWNTGDLDGALRYYRGEIELEGKRFSGFYRSRDLLYLSEWGVATHFRDLLRVIEEAKNRYPAAKVFYMGHSMGSMWGELFSAYDLDCDPQTPALGQDLLDGAVLLDGSLRPLFGVGTSAVNEEAYRRGLPFSLSGIKLSLPGVDTLREGAEIITDLGIPGVFLALELSALAHLLEPGKEIIQKLSESFPTVALFLQLFHGGVISGDGSALLGLALDDDYEPLSFARLRMGRIRGPEIPHMNLISLSGDSGEEILYSPGQKDAFYRWNDQEEHRDPPPLTSLDDVAFALSYGPSNFLEWYFPLRILVDLAVILPNFILYDTFPSWMWKYGLCFGSFERVNLPVLYVSAGKGVAPDRQSYDFWLHRTRIQDRTPLELPDFNHLDLLLSSDPEKNPLLDALTLWLESH
jgi:pimeloyl-ACP methyl ester carboxylesterase